MQKVINFTIAGNAIALKRHRTFRRGEFTGTYDSSKNDKMDFLAKAMQFKPEKPLDVPLYVMLDFRFPIFFIRGEK